MTDDNEYHDIQELEHDDEDEEAISINQIKDDVVSGDKEDIEEPEETELNDDYEDEDEFEDSDDLDDLEYPGDDAEEGEGEF